MRGDVPKRREVPQELCSKDLGIEMISVRIHITKYTKTLYDLILYDKQ